MMKQLLLFALILLPGSSGVLANSVDEREPLTIIEETTTRMLATLDERRDEFTADPAQLRTIVREDLLPLLDLEYSARLILGRAGRDVEPEQLDAFSQAMSSVLVNRYADGLLEFRSDKQLEVLPMKGKNTEKLTRVRTRIKLEAGGFTPVDYAFRKTAQGWKAFDVTVEGISYIITFRNQISPRVATDGIEKVTQEILAGSIRLDE